MKRLTLRTFMQRHKDEDITLVDTDEIYSIVMAWRKPRTNVWVEVRVTLPGWLVSIRYAAFRKGRESQQETMREALGIKAP